MESAALQRQSRLHARTLAMLNHCVDTARRDAAFQQLLQLVEQESFLGDSFRTRHYACCLKLVREVASATRRSSPILYNRHLALADRPVLHFLHLLEQLLQTLHALSLHAMEMHQEGELLQELLGDDVWRSLDMACHELEKHEGTTRLALRQLIPVGRVLLQENSEQRKSCFQADETRRYERAFAEYRTRYSQSCGIVS